MTPEEVLEIERRFGVKLPPAYLRYLGAYPEELRQLYYDHRTWRCHICDEEFLEKSSALAELNEGFRRWPRPIDGEVEVAHTQFGAIGSDVGGNYHLIRVNRDDPRVYFYDHETAEVWPASDGLDSFASELIQSWEEYDAPKGKEPNQPPEPTR